MSIDALMIACTGCDYEGLESFQAHRVIYRSDASGEVDGRSEAGWCYECHGYRQIEWMNPEAIAVEMAELENTSARHQAELEKLSRKYFFNLGRRSAKYRMVEGELRRTARRIANLQNLYAIALRRSSKPRCLVCGCSNTADLDFKNGMTRSFRHKCGGRLRIDAHPLGLRINFGLAVRCYVLDEEGNRLETRVEPRKLPPKHGKLLGWQQR